MSGNVCIFIVCYLLQYSNVDLLFTQIEATHMPTTQSSVLIDQLTFESLLTQFSIFLLDSIGVHFSVS